MALLDIYYVMALAALVAPSLVVSLVWLGCRAAMARLQHRASKAKQH